MFKVIGHMGDGLENIFLGLISSILPKNNTIAQHLSKTSKSNYYFQATIKSGHSGFEKLRIFEISACRRGCCAFIDELVNEEFCPICDKPNDPLENETIYYFPLRDRIGNLLLSDFKKFMSFTKLRRPPNPEFIEDIYDGANWKWFESQMNLERLKHFNELVYLYLFLTSFYNSGGKFLLEFNFAGTVLICSIIAGK